MNALGRYHGRGVRLFAANAGRVGACVGWRGRKMPPLEPIWVAFVTVVLVGCVVLGVRAFWRRRR